MVTTAQEHGVEVGDPVAATQEMVQFQFTCVVDADLKACTATHRPHLIDSGLLLRSGRR